MTHRRWRPIGTFSRAFGRWLAWNMGWFFLFFLILPASKPQQSGSWTRFADILPSNIGLTYYEFYGGLWLLLFMVGWLMFFKFGLNPR